MSTEPETHAAIGHGRPCHSLVDYIRGLIHALDRTDPEAGKRLRAVVGARRARITLDAETTDVRFGRRGLQFERPRPAIEPDGRGATDRATVLAILDARLEVTDAILRGLIYARGDIDAVARIFLAIEILLDAAVRGPELQQLAREFRDDPCYADQRAIHWPPETRIGLVEAMVSERALLGRLDLLP